MSLYPFRNVDGSPNVCAMYVNALMDCALYHNDESAANLYASVAGVTKLDWDNDQTTLRPDSVVFRDATDALVVYSGTTNVTQWVVHVGGSVIPIIDPITLDSMLTTVWSGTLQSLPVMSDIIQPIINGGGTVRTAGHSYGGGCAFTLAVWLKKLRNARVEVQTFGEPKVFGGLTTIPEPEVHFRVVAESKVNPDTGVISVDPVSQMPPGALQYAGLGYLFKIPAFVLSMKFFPRGTPVRLSDTQMVVTQDSFLWSVPFVSEYLLAFQLPEGTELHLMDTSYLPKVHAAWLRSGECPELHAFDSFYASWTGTPYVAPVTYGPPLSYEVINTALELQDTPITSANNQDWTNVSSVGTLIPYYYGPTEGTTMSLMKGSMLCGAMQQGFSESFHSANSAKTYAGMLSDMQAAMNARAALSVTINSVLGGNKNNALKFTAIRVSDDLLNRDVFPTPVETPSGWVSPEGNMDAQQAIKIIWRAESGAQIAVSYLHCIPVNACTADPGNEERSSPMEGTWITFLNSYCAVLKSKQLGFNTINNTPSNAFGPITTPVYNTVTGFWTIGTTNAVPVGKFRAALRGFKSLRFLNGRQSCQSVGANSFVVFKKVPNGVWDNSGSAVPLSGYNNGVPFSNYIVQVPDSATASIICTKKLGRPFFLQAGRISRVAA